MSMMPGFLQQIGVKVLGSRWTRQLANEMGYYDKSFANKDAVDVSCVHVENPGEEHCSLFSLSFSICKLWNPARSSLN